MSFCCRCVRLPRRRTLTIFWMLNATVPSCRCLTGECLKPHKLDELRSQSNATSGIKSFAVGLLSAEVSFGAILRGQDAEALASYWGYTVKPLMELLRMRYCPMPWDFGIRYINRDLPASASDRFRELVFVCELEDLKRKLPQAETWGIELLRGLIHIAPERAALGSASRKTIAPIGTSWTKVIDLKS